MIYDRVLTAVLFGIVEGITEWLPISSTGHMILLDEFVKLDVSEDFLQMYLVVIQLGAILAVVVLFWNQIWPFGKDNKTKPVKQSGFLSYCKRDIWILWQLACLRLLWVFFLMNILKSFFIMASAWRLH